MVKKNKVSYVSVPEDCGTLKVGSTKSNYHSQFMFFYMPLASIIDIRIYIRYFCIHTSGDFPRARPNGAALSLKSWRGVRRSAASVWTRTGWHFHSGDWIKPMHILCLCQLDVESSCERTVHVPDMVSLLHGLDMIGYYLDLSWYGASRPFVLFFSDYRELDLNLGFQAHLALYSHPRWLLSLPVLWAMWCYMMSYDVTLVGGLGHFLFSHILRIMVPID